MKRYAVVAITLVAAVGMVTAVFASIQRKDGMQVQFNTRDLPEHGIHIVTPVDKSFDDLAAIHFKNRSPESLKPFAVFIKNSGHKPVLAYALKWELRDQDGRLITSNTIGYSELGLLMGDEIPKDVKHTNTIEPGAMRCFSWDSQIEQDAVEAVGATGMSSRPLPTVEGGSSILASKLSQATNVSVSVDGVFFEDGTFVGPNTTGYFEQIQAMLNARVDLLREIAVASKKGNLDEVLDSITATSREPQVVFSERFVADEYYRFFRKIYATEITAQHYAYGKERVVPFLLQHYERARPSLRKE